MHSMRGMISSKLTYQYLQSYLKKRPFVTSHGSFPGSGAYSGHVIFPDSTWNNLKYSVSAMFNMQLFGIPYFGTAIWGYNGDTSTDLCTRWHQLGAFMPLSLNFNGKTSIPQEPYSLGTLLRMSASSAINLKYELLLYHYYLFWNTTVDGGAYITPLFYTFDEPTDPSIPFYTIQDQFMFGDGLMVAPVLENNQRLKQVVLGFLICKTIDLYPKWPILRFLDRQKGDTKRRNDPNRRWQRLYTNVSSSKSSICIGSSVKITSYPVSKFPMT